MTDFIFERVDDFRVDADLNVPVIQLPADDPMTDFYVDCEGDSYKVGKLYAIVKDDEPFLVPVAALSLSDKIWQDCTMLQLALHVKKCMKADTEAPILLDWNGDLADGRHRVIKAICDGKKHILCKRLFVKPEPDMKYDPRNF
jgi:hypothetical protein